MSAETDHPQDAQDVGDARADVPLAEPPELRTQLVELLGGLRAEWLGRRLYGLYRQPEYLPELLTAKPCLLFGGRGTGKTTVLKALSYEGQQALEPESPVRQWPFYGIYWRLDTNQVTAFSGKGLEEDEWARVFAHYVNLNLCSKVVEFLRWYRDATDTGEPLPENVVRLVARSLHLEVRSSSLDALDEALELAFVDFEARLNNIVDTGPGLLSLQAAPVNLLVKYLRLTPVLADRLLFFLIDEYENLLDYQQRVLNTFIKHSGIAYTFKVGVKLTGLRDHATLAQQEAIQEPADYTSIDISQRLVGIGFEEFVRGICNERLGLVQGQGLALEITEALPNLSEAREAELLGIRGRLSELRTDLAASGATPPELGEFDALAPLHAYLVKYWASAKDLPVLAVLRDLLADNQRWSDRLGNYQHAMLYTLRTGKKGYRLHKYYAGWDTYTYLAKGNVRYLLQLVLTAFLSHLDEGKRYGDPISYESQTTAAIAVGRRNIDDLPGLDRRGADLTSLVLSLGRVFEVLARNPEGHAPEITQFHVSDGGALDVLSSDVEELLDAGVRNLAFVRFTSNKKPLTSGDPSDYDYALHPIMAPFFGFSYRSKRRLTVSERELHLMLDEPARGISAVLDRHGRNVGPLPQQLGFFADFYDAPS